METTHESSKQTLCSAQPAKPYAFSRKVFCEGMRDGVPGANRWASAQLISR